MNFDRVDFFFLLTQKECQRPVFETIIVLKLFLLGFLSNNRVYWSYKINK